MTTKTFFYTTRTLARAAAADLQGKFQDCGSDAPKGERWAVVVPVLDIACTEAESQEIKGIPSVQDVQASLNKTLTIARKPKGVKCFKRHKRGVSVQNHKNGKSAVVYYKAQHNQHTA